MHSALYYTSYLIYFQALAAHADTNLGKFEPALAFICNKPAMHRVVNGWEADFNKSTSCIDDPDDILDYCKKVSYPRTSIHLRSCSGVADNMLDYQSGNRKIDPPLLRSFG